MKFVRAFFSLIASMTATVFGPIWNHAKTMRALSNLLLLLAILITCAWTLFWVSQKPVFTLNHLTVESLDGRELKHVNLPTIKARALDQVKGNFFTIRLDQARQAFETMPWVRKASVRREWPNGIVVAIEEHQALGVWVGSDTPKLMNTYGEVFVANMAEAEDSASLLRFSGPEGSNKEVFRKLQQLNHWFEPWQATVQNLDLSSRYAWRVKLSNGLNIELGRELDDRDAKQIQLSVERLLKSWPQVQEKWGQRVDSIDLRYANGYAINIGKKL
jgi:cell division protein FtsQ